MRKDPIKSPNGFEWNEAFSYKDGFIYWKSRDRSEFDTDRQFTAWHTRNLGNRAGTTHNSHQMVMFHKRLYMLHRIIWQMHFGPIPDNMVIDHINCISTDNRIENLRLATRQENNRNRRPVRGSKSGYKGVSWISSAQRWRAQIVVDNKTEHIGQFKCPLRAHLAYVKRSRELFGNFARHQ